ncbi:alpha/beta hydrolase [Roseisalinus antarcticus]|uniref:Alpha/beta hydrolase family protein n=1 Tax=Roseisalinus antarcticus TaxID=254357 RepID=A0A1Y5SBK0_9RHOB|nr:alpha/beta hydrolase [Roseisalinus antarcticus]SLN36248.1 Alpha/beta hydrolase family protein [Roseisalinus antarcticus]
MDPDDPYAVGVHIAGGDRYPYLWAHAAAEFRAAQPPRVLRYGPGGREAIDLFLPDAPPRGLVIFVHGGFWMQCERSDWSHLATGPLAAGWGVAVPGYELCPDVRISQITAAIARAVGAAAAEVTGPIRLVGHSAGGHLVARMGCADVALPERGRIARILPISPLGDLAPLRETPRNATLRLDAGEARTESPQRHPPPTVPVTIWVGAEERPAFLSQARALARSWQAPLTEEAGRHHFDVIDGLTDARSPVCRALLA